ncbi:MAG: tandem-95 repeat protein [Planctomycetota bacterium]|nr:tandem-95 repeat protein [Planctomycetota bacterium]
MTHTRLTSLRSSRTSSQRRNAERRTRRSVRLFERLEDRNLLSGDSLAFHNAFWPADVDNSLKVTPQDALYVVNALNNGGSRQLASAAAASGEAGTTSSEAAISGYIDVNGDGLLTPTDALGVINALNGGEGETATTDLVRYNLTVTDTSNVALPTNADGSFAVTKGQTFRLHGSLQDVRNIVMGEGSTGVFAGYINIVAANSSLISLRYGETQQLLLVPTTHTDNTDPAKPVQVPDTITGTFTLTFQTQTTQPINAQASIDPKTGAVLKSRAQLIQDALAALPNIGAGNVEVTKSLTNDNAFNIRFVNDLGERDLPGMLGNFTSLVCKRNNTVTGPVQSGTTVTDNFYTASLSNPGTFASSFVHVSPYINGPSPSADSAVPASGGAPLAEVGSFLSGFSVEIPGGEKEFFTVDIQAQLPGEVDFSGALPSTPTGHETLVFPSSGAAKFTVDPSLIGFVQDAKIPSSLLRLKITAPVVAGTSQFTVAEDSVNNALDVLANSTVNAAANGVVPKVLAGVGALSDANAGTISFSTGATGKATFTPTPNYNGTVTFAYTVNDSATPTAHSDIGTATITVTPVNDAPSFVQGGNKTVDEDVGARTFAGWATSILAGPSNEQANQTVDFLVTNSNGALFSAAPAVSPDGTLTFTPAPNANGTATVTVRLHDNGSTDNQGQNTSAPQTFTITINAINDTPVNTMPTGSFQMVSGQPVIINGISVADPLDAPWLAVPNDEIVNVTLRIDQGTAQDKLTLLSVPTGLSVPGNGTASTLQIQDKIGLINAALAGGLKYEGTLGAHTLTVITDDLGNVGGPGSLTATNTLSIVPPKKPFAVNDQFAVDENSGVHVFNVLTNDISFVSGQADGANLRIMSVDPSGVHNGGTVTTNGSTVTYTRNGLFNGTDTFTYVAADATDPTNGDGASTGTVTVTVDAVNNSPVITLGASKLDTLEDHQANPLPQGFITITDPDVGTGQMKATVTVADGTVTLGATNGLLFTTGTGTNDAQMVFTGTLQQLNDSVTGAKFTPTTDFNGDGTIVIVVDDQGNTGKPGPLTATATLTISVSPVNDAPSVTASDPVAVNESSGTQTVPGWAVFSPGPTNESDQTLVQYTVAGVSNTALFSVAPAVANNGTLTFTPATNAFGSSTFTVTAQDSGPTAANDVNTSSPKTFTITVRPVNNAPTVNFMSARLSVNENTPTVSSSLLFRATDYNDIVVADIDADAAPTNPGVTVTLSVSHGTLVAVPTTGVTVTGSETNLVLSGLVAKVNEALNGLKYTPTVNFEQTDVIQVVVNDSGNFGSGGAKSASASLAITINPVNDPPAIAAPASITTGQNRAYPFTGLNAVAVTDQDAGSGALVVKLAATNGAIAVGSGSGVNFTDSNGADGTLTFSGTLTQIKTALDGLTYTPSTGYTGSASLKIDVNDQGFTGLLLAGQTAEKTVTISVAPVNQTPTAKNDSITTSEGSPPVTFNVFENHGNGVDAVGGVDLATGTPLPDSPGNQAGTDSQTIHVLAVDTTGLQGTLTYTAATGSFTYTPPSQYFNTLGGPEKFTYTVEDNGFSWDDAIAGFKADAKSSTPATVTITVTEVNNPPIANDYLWIIQANPTGGQPFTINESDLLTTLAKDQAGPMGANEGSQTISVLNLGTASSGTVRRADGVITYTLPSDLTVFNHVATFTYKIEDNGTTNGTLERKTSTATVTIRDVIPKILSGFVYVDMNGDGVKGSGEPGIGGVTVTLTGTEIGGRVLTGDSARTVVTGFDGKYEFKDLLPSETGTNYTVTETQPGAFADGRETVGDQGGSVAANDQLSIPVPLLNYANGGTLGKGNNFGESGTTTSESGQPAMTDAYVALVLQSLLASPQNTGSSSSTGLMFGTDENGIVLWSINLGKWEGYQPGVKTGVDGRYQVPLTYTNDTPLQVTDVYDATQLPKVSSILNDPAKQTVRTSVTRVTRIFGSPEVFHLPSHTQTVVAGEGEGGATVGDQQLQLLANSDTGSSFAQAVDAIFADSGNPLA